MMKSIIISFLLLCSNFIVNAQNHFEYDELKTVFEQQTTEPIYYSYKENNKNIMEKVITSVFVFYKKFISSQDGNSCTFTPSCSEHAILSVQKNGLLIGMLSSFDRLTRCNGLSPEHYDRDTQTGLLIDFVY